MQMPVVALDRQGSEDLLPDTLSLAERQAIEAQQLLDKASANYKRLKHIQYEGDTEENIYGAALQSFDDAVAALRHEGVTPQAVNQCRGMLFDINPLLAKGAVYYSKIGDQVHLNRAAMDYVDMQNMPEVADMRLVHDPQMYPQMVYIASSAAYNNGEYDRALGYFANYLDSGDTRYRENVAQFMAQTALATNQPERALNYMQSAVAEYPTNAKLLGLAIRVNVATGNTDGLQSMLSRALLINPDDEELLKVQADLYEAQYDFKRALDIWNTLAEKHPQSLNINQRVAQAYYNLGVGYYNESINAKDEKEAKKASRMSKQYFEAAIPKLQEIVANMPTSTKYLKALGVAYGCLDLRSELEGVNARLTALGSERVASNQMPGIMTSSEVAAPTGAAGLAENTEVPTFEEFATTYVQPRMAQWSKKGEFEDVNTFTARLEAGTNAEYERLLHEAEKEYIKKYSSRLRITDLKLSQYDTDNQTFKVTTEYGDAIIKVPAKNREAENFKANWDAVKIRNPQYIIRNNRVGLASIAFATPAGKIYEYNAEDAATYNVTDYKVDLGTYVAETSPTSASPSGNTSGSASQTAVFGKKSDVDENIPLTTKINDDTFVLIIANEDYQKVMPVASARHDGDVFKEYCVNTLGVPEHRVLYYPDATRNDVTEALDLLKKRVKGSGIEPKILFYYAGHGLPDDESKGAYMLPVDANSMVVKTWVPMSEIYSELTSIQSQGVFAFVDACFSGASRSANKDDMLNKTRGVSLAPKIKMPTAGESLFVLTAASGSETALPYKDKNHGLFTYYLLKRLQESKGRTTLGELADYVKKNVSKTAGEKLIKEQTPTVITSGPIGDDWHNIRLRK